MLKIIQYLYTLWAALTLFLLLIPMVVLYFIVGWISNGKAERIFLAINFLLVTLWAMLTGIICVTRRNPKVDKKRAYVFVCNHSSMLDAIIVSHALQYRVRVMAKKEVLKMPLLGTMFKWAAIIVDRSDKASRKRSQQNLLNFAKRGVSVQVFPEGTRNKTGKPLLDFYNGAFRTAIEAQIPIVPVILLNAGKLMPKGGFLVRPGILKAHILDPIEVAGLTEDNLETLKQKTWQIMHDKIVALDPRFNRS